ncbi:MAG: hypothetical protein LKCHEGNO_01291 [Burkholderiaceae bacterium]|nr:hypothetical protein [Burkholderiaceae bacterium]
MHRGAGERVGSQRTGEREAQRVGAAAREVLLVARDAPARAHGAGVELAAVAVVVAHLDRFREAERGVAAAARGAQRLGRGVVLHVPGRPVERGLDGNRAMAGREAEQRHIVHSRRVDDAVRAEQVVRVEVLLDGAKRLVQPRAELPGDPLAATQAVAVLAAVGALELAHQLGGFLCDRAHLGRPVATHVEDRPHVQRADRRVRVPGAARAVAREHLGQRRGVLGQVRQRYRAVFDEADRLAVALEAHHDVEPGLAHLPQRLLRRRFGHLHHAARQPEVAHQLDQRAQAGALRRAVVAAELHQQDRLGFADECTFDHRRERRVGARQLDHRAVDQLDRGGAERNDVLRAVHRTVEAREVDDAQHLGARQGRELQVERLDEAERALGADEQVRQVDRAVDAVRPLAHRLEDIEVVAADAPHHARPARLDVVVARLDEAPNEARGGRRAPAQRGQRSGVQRRAVGQPQVHAQHVVHHVAVRDRARAARVVARHAAERGLRAGRHVDREPQAVPRELRVQRVEHEAGLHARGARVDVEREHAAQVFAAIDHQAGAHGLAALAGARAARQHRHPQFTGDLDRVAHVGVVGGDEHAHRHHLVDRRVGGVAAARGGVEPHLAARVRAQLACQLDAGVGGGLQPVRAVELHRLTAKPSMPSPACRRASYRAPRRACGAGA